MQIVDYEPYLVGETVTSNRLLNTLKSEFKRLENCYLGEKTLCDLMRIYGTMKLTEPEHRKDQFSKSSLLS